MRRVLAVLLAAVAAIAAGCGDDAGGGGAPASSEQRLSATQYDAIENLFVATIAARERQKRSSQPFADAVMRPVFDACLALDGADPLLSAMYESCPVLGTLTATAAQSRTCGADNRCRSRLREMKEAAQRLVAAARVADGAVNATQLASACKRVLLTSKQDYAWMRAFVGLSERMLSALDAGSRSELLAATAELARLRGPADETKRQLRALRRSCR